MKDSERAGVPGAADRSRDSRAGGGAPDPGEREGDPPYVPSHEAAAEIQDEHETERPIPLLPANAAGSDHASVDDQSEPADKASMYERRPAPEHDLLRRRG